MRHTRCGHLIGAIAVAACATERGPFTNRMSQSTTPYLARAAREPVGWQPWGRDAFALAMRLDRPVLLYVGAEDCRWCAVMDREDYADPDLAALIDSLYVPVRVDRDEHPDVARRYAEEVRTLTGLSGLPLTVILTPDGAAYFGGTYFAPDDPVTGRGLRQILPEMARAYHDEHDATVQRAALVRQLAIGSGGSTHAALRPAAVDSGIAAVRAGLARALDAPGGVGGFAATQAVTLLIGQYGLRGDTASLAVARRALAALLDSGAVGAAAALDDPPLVVRAGLARALALAWVVTADPRYRAEARDVTRALAHGLADPGGRTIFTDREAYAAASLLEAASAVDDTAGRGVALRALDALLRQTYAPGYGVRHTLVGQVDGLLQDQVQMGAAALAAYEATGARRYLDVATALAAVIERDYADPQGGYFDAAAGEGGPAVIADRSKQVLDDILPAGDPAAARLLVRLAAVTGDERYRRRAEAALESVADGAAGRGLRASTYLDAARLLLAIPHQ